MRGLALTLALKQRHRRTRKWPIRDNDPLITILKPLSPSMTPKTKFSDSSWISQASGRFLTVLIFDSTRKAFVERVLITITVS